MQNKAKKDLHFLFYLMKPSFGEQLRILGLVLYIVYLLEAIMAPT